MKNILTILLLFLSLFSFAQVELSGNETENAKAEFKVVSPLSNKGVLIPRMPYANFTGIASPPEGLLVYNSDNNTFYYYNGSAWVRIGQTCTVIQDEDGDTKVTVEYNADEDIVRFFAKGVEVITHTNNGATQNVGDIYISNGTLKIGTAYSLPTTDGSNKYVLTTNGSGTLSWKNPATLPGLVAGLQSIPLGLGREFQPLSDKAFLTAIIPWSNLTINNISTYITVSGSPNIEMGIYENNTLLASGTTSPTVNGFISVTLNTSVQLKAGSLYRVAIIDRAGTGTSVLENPDLTNSLNWTLERALDGLGAPPNQILKNPLTSHRSSVLKSMWFCLY